MRLQLQPVRWGCLVTSFAMALDAPVAEIIREIGHDGSQMLWPDLPEPLCRRGFHPQELIDVCRARGYAATMIETSPALKAINGRGSAFRVLDADQAGDRLLRIIQTTQGVIESVPEARSRHTVAYNQGRIFDPSGSEFSFSDATWQRVFTIQHLWCVDRIEGVV